MNPLPGCKQPLAVETAGQQDSRDSRDSRAVYASAAVGTGTSVSPPSVPSVVRMSRGRRELWERVRQCCTVAPSTSPKGPTVAIQ